MPDYFHPETLNGPILVGVDGSPSSLVALRWSIAEGRRSHSPVVALMAWSMHPIPHPSLHDSTLTRHEVPDVRFARLLDDIVREAVAEIGGPLPVTRAVPGPTAEVLVEVADDARMLVLGSHGRGRVSTALVGSIVEFCVHNATCPVVVIPSAITRGTTRRPRVLAPDALFPQPYDPNMGPM